MVFCGDANAAARPTCAHLCHCACHASPPCRTYTTIVPPACHPHASTVPTTITTRDIGRPVEVKGYGVGLLMYWGLYHKTGRPRAGVAFNRPIGLNTGSIEVRGACAFCTDSLYFIR